VANRIALAAIVLPICLTAGCVATTPPQEDPVMVKLQEVERRLSALERVLANGSLVELTVQADELERRVADLQGRTETLEYDAEGTAERQRNLYVDLDDRIQMLERNLRNPVGIASDGATLAPGQLPVPGGTDRDNYQAAFELLKEQKYEAAAQAFQQFMVSFPDSQLSDNAQYWLAESSYVTGKFDEALRQFEVVISQYPRSRKIPDALLKIGYSNYELKRYDAARTALGRVLSDHTDTTAARLAEQRLKLIADEGH
jgi:tol-pal system protein YbgF